MSSDELRNVTTKTTRTDLVAYGIITVAGALPWVFYYLEGFEMAVVGALALISTMIAAEVLP